MTWVIAHSSRPISKTMGSCWLTIHPCYTEEGAKEYAQEQLAKGHQVAAQTLEGETPVRTIKGQDVSLWLEDDEPHCLA